MVSKLYSNSDCGMVLEIYFRYVYENLLQILLKCREKTLLYDQMANSSNSIPFHIAQSPFRSSPFLSPVSLTYFIYVSIISLIFFIHVNMNKNVSKFAGSSFRIELRCIKYSSTGSKTIRRSYQEKHTASNW
jgi:hypothetical protein